MNLAEKIQEEPYTQTDRDLKSGDVILIVDKDQIDGGDDLTNGRHYTIFLDYDGDTYVMDDVEDALYIGEAIDYLGYLVLNHPR